ncbi:MAG: cyclic nucleotide-binding protein [Acidimicrobiia bacterium]|nr:cyclic nucleotide-binding protein [Acidimicrobiia bacterium]
MAAGYSPLTEGEITLQRGMHHSYLDKLKGVELFSGCSSDEIERIAGLTTQIDVAAGRVLCEEGQPGEEFFVIAEGEAIVSSGGKEVARLHGGDFFGELALLDGGARVATVTAGTPMKLLVLNRGEFRSLVEVSTMIDRRILEAIASRLRRPANTDLESRLAGL